MAGHSKWAKVKHFKGAIDAKRARIFARLSRDLTIASRQGGTDPDMNPRLRMVLLKCRNANMPSDNIERAIKKGVGQTDGSEAFEELTYEIFGPYGVALLVEVTTNNRNRTAADIRRVLNRHGGSLATAGSVARLFQRRGQIIIPREAIGEDQLMEIALEAGAEDFRAEPEGFEILTDPGHFEAVHRELDARGIQCANAEITYLPLQTTPLEPGAEAEVNRLVEALEENDDVNEVYTTAEYPNEAPAH